MSKHKSKNQRIKELMLIDSELMSELNKCLELARAEFDEEDEASDFDNYYIEIFKKRRGY